jgi:hypothetical protein
VTTRVFVPVSRDFPTRLDPVHPRYIFTERGTGYRFVDFEGKKALPRSGDTP